MRIQTIALTLTACLGLAACGGSSASRGTSSPASLPPGTLSSAAAKYCTSKGGRIKAEIGRSGRAQAICYLPDQRIVEINALYGVEVVNGL